MHAGHRHTLFWSGWIFSLWCEAQPPSLEALFVPPNLVDLTISPDGRHLAFLREADDLHELLVTDVDKTNIQARFSFRDRQQTIAHYQWIKDNQLMLVPAIKNGWRDQPQATGELYLASPLTHTFKSVVSWHEDSKVELIHDLPADPQHVLMASFPKVGQSELAPTVFRLNLFTGNAQPLYRAPGAHARFFTTPAGEMRFATGLQHDASEYVFYFNAQHTSWNEWARNTFDLVVMDLLSISSDGKFAYYLSDHATGTNGLYRIEIANSSPQLLYRDATDHIANVMIDQQTGSPIWLQLATDRAVVLLNSDHRFARAWQTLNHTFEGQLIQFTSITTDYKKAVFKVSSDRNPGEWYSLDLDKRRLNLEMTANEYLPQAALASVQAIRLLARDQLPLQGFFTAPTQTNADKPPLVVLIHGGPHDHDVQQFDPEVQLLATQGYAVLQINFRGSTGHGQAFINAGKGEWGRKIQDDISDATRWVIQQGWVDPARICIMGSSFGGYAALMGAVRAPQLYRCVISLFGISDLALLFAEGDIPQRLFGKAYLHAELGDDPREWHARSPVHHADAIHAPVLLIHGGADERVPISHALRMESALRAADKTVERYYVAGESHGFYDARHRINAYETVLGFLRKYNTVSQSPPP